MPDRLNVAVGQRYGKLTTLENLGTRPPRRKHGYWKCLCDCGSITVVRADGLSRGTTQSCGCYQRERVTKHGRDGMPEFRIWTLMKRRCNSTADPAYGNYGGRGVAVCAEWQDFDQFLADMGLRPSARYTLERKDNDLGYSPGNCKWATRTEQGVNKRNNRHLTFQGQTLTVSQWTALRGWKRSTLYQRLYAGWSVERALTESP